MKELILPITISLLIVSITGCSLLPPSATMPNPTSLPPSLPPTGFEPQPGDAKLTRDKVFLELENSSLAVMESYPIQASAILNGSLSDPCHQLRVVVKRADATNQINLEVYSVFDPNVECITVIKPFNATIPLGSYTDGHYTVFVNGQLLGEFDA